VSARWRNSAGEPTIPRVTTLIPREWLDRIERLRARGGRRILGVAGTPGAGKSSLAEALVETLGQTAALVPMDGFHLAQGELERLGRAERKGAPDTFDAAGYAALLLRLREMGNETVYAPMFRREIEEPIAGAIAIGPDVDLVVTEGNYLLREGDAWARVRPLLDECWFVDIGRDDRVARLIDRHVRFGRPPEEAKAWVLRSDEANAELIEACRERADFFVQWPPGTRQ
jgi:pantothenate kinase